MLNRALVLYCRLGRKDPTTFNEFVGGCQNLLTQNPDHYGWLKRKHYLDKLGSRMGDKASIPIAALTSKIPWSRYFVVLKDRCLYVFDHETADKPKKMFDLSQCNRVDTCQQVLCADVPWPFQMDITTISEAGQPKKETEFFCSTSKEEREKWIEVVRENITQEDLSFAKEEPKAKSRALPPRGQKSTTFDHSAAVEAQPSLRSRPVPTPPVFVDEDDRKSSVAPPRRSKNLPPPPTQEKPRPPQKPIKGNRPPDVVPQQRRKEESEDENDYDDYENPEDQALYEFVENVTLAERSLWTGTANDAQVLMKDCTEVGVYLLRDSSKGDEQTLQVKSDTKVLKFSITKPEGNKRTMAGMTFKDIEELLRYFEKNEIPNKTQPNGKLTLRKPYKDYFKMK